MICRCEVIVRVIVEHQIQNNDDKRFSRGEAILKQQKLWVFSTGAAGTRKNSIEIEH
jgi:hypothetical protein